MDIIELEDMEFYACHGCYELEQRVGGRFSVTLHMEADLKETIKTDDVNTSVNYLSVYEMVDRQMKITSHTLEHVSGRILDSLFAEFPQVKKASVKVSKLSPPLGGKIDKVSVTLAR